MNTINEKLHALYASKWQNLVSGMKSILQDDNREATPASPLLIKIDDENAYEQADIKLMIFGQETNRWYESFHGDMDAIIGYYDEFFNEGQYLSYHGHFWNGVLRFFELLKSKYPGKSIYLVWNNIAKIGKDEGIGFPPDDIHEVEREHFSVIQEEIAILKPTLALFLTGPRYDSVIEEIFGQTSFNQVNDNFSSRQLASLSLPNIVIALRTYHPGYLWRNDINHYFTAILDQIDLQLPNTY
ncbi:hypothetical protein [Hymenobacter terricola]|uniref:hypothetical protein n=1 Tax=Hymenobacter terricola TaxID=2819236 RepID=UPI001B313CC8|nr:hypothetical protein [Hymenobacter terricola]